MGQQGQRSADQHTAIKAAKPVDAMCSSCLSPDSTNVPEVVLNRGKRWNQWNHHLLLVGWKRGGWKPIDAMKGGSKFLISGWPLLCGWYLDDRLAPSQRHYPGRYNEVRIQDDASAAAYLGFCVRRGGILFEVGKDLGWVRWIHTVQFRLSWLN